jgi:hypothetical protein
MVLRGCLFDDKEVCVPVRGLASNCGPEITYAAFLKEVYLPVKEGTCTCSVLLKSG